MIEGIQRWFKEKISKYKEKKEKETLIKEYGFLIFCPNCRAVLNEARNELLEDESIAYMCECGTNPIFAYHIAPVPIYLGERNETKD